MSVKRAALKATKKTDQETVAKPAEKPATNGASKKRKAVEDTEPEDVVEVPKAKKSRTITKTKAAAKPPAKAASKAPAKKATAKPAKAPAKKAKVVAKPVKELSPPAPEAEEESEEEKEEEEEEAKVEEVEKKPKKAASRPPKIAIAKKSATPRETGIGKKINEAPTQILDVYVFGEGTSGELGLGSRRINKKKPIDVKRPRLNDNLSAADVGVVQVACGGMHVAALTHDNKILTWGVNDQGALGRDTNWDGGLRDVDDDESEDEDDTGMNPKESTPTAVSDKHFLPGTKFVQVVASDSATFALTETGKVYGWGTFRSSDGILGFSETIRVQNTPLLVPSLKNIKALAAGANHILALDHKGHVVAWGCGQQNQLGRRIIERNKMSSLIPQGVGLPRGKIVKIACGSYHSFAIDKDGAAWGWGLNNFGEIGVESNAGEDDAVILKPAKLTYLEDETIIDIDGGGHHSLACTDKGELYTWGRVDGYQVGFEFEDLEKENVIFDERGAPRILFKPTLQEDVPNTISVAAGTDNNFAVTKEGKAYSWGFSSNYQTGQGTIEDIKVPTQIDNTAIRGKQIIRAGAGGQYSVLVGIAAEVNGVQTNGVNGDKH